MFPKYLRIATTVIPKTVWINETTAIEKMFAPTFYVSELNLLAKTLRFSYDLFHPDDKNSYGWVNSNGNWTGVLGMIERHETNMTMPCVAVVEDIHEPFALSFPTRISEVTFMTRRHEFVPDPTAFLHPFSYQVWLSVMACLFIMPLVFRCLMRKTKSTLTLFTSILRSLVGQGVNFEPHKPMDYILLTFWILSSALLVYFYAAVLLSFVTFPSLQGIRTIEDLANGIKAGKYYCATYPDIVFESIFFNSTNPSLRVIANCLAKNKRTWEVWDFLDNSTDDKIPVYIGFRRDFLPYKDVYFISEENFFSLSAAYAVHKDFCCKYELDAAVHHISASGIVEYMHDLFNVKAFLKNSMKYGENWYTPQTEVQLTMTTFKGPFLFLVVSHALAFLVFLMEICIGQFKSRNGF